MDDDFYRFRQSFEKPKIYNYTGQHKISFWDKSIRVLLILGR